MSKLLSRLPLLAILATALVAVQGCSLLMPPKGSPGDPHIEQMADNAIIHNLLPPPQAWSDLPTVAGGQCTSPHDLWYRLRKDFALSRPDQPRLRSELAWYAQHRGYLERVADRAKPYLYLIMQEVEKRHMPGEIALLPIVESAFQPFAYSHGRAAGLWQIVPTTGRRFGLQQDWWYDGRRDVLRATRAALDYLVYLHGFFHGDWLLALAAYNSGEGTVMRAVRYNERHHKPTDFWSLDLPAETQGYVPKLLAIAALVDNPPRYGVVLPSVADEPYLVQVDVQSQIDLALAAELADIDLEDIYRYNPAYNRWATHPNGPHTLLIPAEHVAEFEAGLAEFPPQKRVQWRRHHIAEGETLSTIAKRYHTTAKLIADVNGLDDTLIRVGKTLLIPVARKSLNEYRMTASRRTARIKSQVHDGYRNDYVVRSGDSMWDIARRYGVGVMELAKWNGMAPRDPLHLGQKLVIWTDEPQDHVGSIANFAHPPKDRTTRRIGYTVRAGDSLARISERFKVSVANLRRWNKLQGTKYLKPGQQLTLFVDVTRQADI